MKFSTLIFCSFVASMPSYSSGSNGGGYGGMNNYEGGSSNGYGQKSRGGRKPHGGMNNGGMNNGGMNNGGGGDYGPSPSQGGGDYGSSPSQGGGDYGSSPSHGGGDYGSNPSQGGGGKDIGAGIDLGIGGGSGTGDQGDSNDQQRLAELNAVRAKVGAPPLQLSAKLKQAAQSHSEDQAKTRNMSHTGSDGSSPTQRINKAGIRGGQTGENVAWNQKNFSEARKVWTNSPGHYKNMVDKGFKYVGFGESNKYYTENFSSNN